MEGRSARNCRRNGVNPAISAKGKTPDKNRITTTTTTSLLGAQHIRDIVENKPASLLVVSLGKALNGMPQSLCGRQMVGPSSLPVVVAQSDERHANRT